jgi:hypothetical protein
LHTSDWHIGRSLHGAELLREQEAVLSGLADVVVAESVDAVVVAGGAAGADLGRLTVAAGLAVEETP